MNAPQGSWSKFLLSIEGRVTRSQYWACSLGITVPLLVLAVALNRSIGRMEPAWILLIFGIWPLWIVAIKRWHDRDKSGWWMLIALVPIIGQFWQLIENGFLRGTSGPNRYGPDPLAGEI